MTTDTLSEETAREDLRQLTFAITGTTGQGDVRRIPLKAQDYLLRSLTGRTRALPGLARQAVRLVVALDRIEPRGYIHALHGALPVLRVPAFQSLLARSADKNVVCAGETLVLTGGGLDAEQGGAFMIELSRLPLVAAYLDAAHLMLGFDGVESLLAPAMDGGAAEPVAAALHAAVSAWLNARLQREHLTRQAQVIRAFMMARGVRGADDVDDEGVLAFWLAHGVEETRIDGFRMWRNAVRQVVAYRGALRDAGQAAGIEAPLGTDPDSGGVDLSRMEGEAVETGHWISPLAALADPPANAVKWLSGKDQADLASLVPLQNAEGGADLEGSAFADMRPEPRLYLTWLRFVAFGQHQARLVDIARKGNGLRPQTTPYNEITARFAAHAASLQLVREACTWDLLRRAPAHGLALALSIDREAVIAALPTRMDAQGAPQPPTNQDWANAASRLCQGSSPLAERCRRAFLSINRAGFRKTDADDPDMGAALCAGALWLLPLERLLAEVGRWSGSHDPAAAFAADRPRFEAAFASLYPDLADN